MSRLSELAKPRNSHHPDVAGQQRRSRSLDGGLWCRRALPPRWHSSVCRRRHSLQNRKRPRRLGRSSHHRDTTRAPDEIDARRASAQRESAQRIRATPPHSSRPDPFVLPPLGEAERLRLESENFHRWPQRLLHLPIFSPRVHCLKRQVLTCGRNGPVRAALDR